MPRRTRRQKITPYQVITIFALLYFFMIVLIILWRTSGNQLLQALKEAISPFLPNTQIPEPHINEWILVAISVILSITIGVLTWIYLKMRDLESR